MAEEDLIFGKNRHMFGGIEPNNMKKFTVTRNIAKNRVEITAQLPGDTMINDQLLCTIGGAVIRRKTTGYPVDEFDGDFVAKITESGTKTIIDTGADANTVYYYAAFPFSTQDVYNRSHTNRAKYDYPAVGYYFGFDLDTTKSDPATRVTYPSDVQNYGYTAAKMNRTTNAFEYGSWPSTPGDKFMPRPCVVRINNVTSELFMDCYLNPNDYSKGINGESPLGYGQYDYYGKFMVEWPKIYTHREVVNGIYKFRCCDVPLGDDWDCLCNYDANNNQIDHFYTAIYQGCYSYSGSKPSYVDTSDIYANSRSAEDWVSQIKHILGSDWNPSVLADRLLIQDLLIMMAKTTDLSRAYGCWQSSSSEIENGIFDKNGMFYANSSATAVKVFGMEHLWSNLYPRFLQGFLVNKGVIKVKLTSGTHDGTTATDYNLTGQGYLTVADLKTYQSTTGSYNGYISSMINNAYGRIPIGKSGSSDTYECGDFAYFIDSSDSTVKIATVGTGYRPGPFSIKATDSATDAIPVGSIALSLKPREGSF